MSVPPDLFEKIKRLPENKQLVVKSLIEELTRSAGEPAEGSQEDWHGSLEGLKIAINDEEIAKARREMWSEFPRDVNH